MNHASGSLDIIQALEFSKLPHDGPQKHWSGVKADYVILIEGYCKAALKLFRKGNQPFPIHITGVHTEAMHSQTKAIHPPGIFTNENSYAEVVDILDFNENMRRGFLYSC